MAGAQPYSKDKYHTAWSWTYNRKDNFLISNCLFMKLLMISENHQQIPIKYFAQPLPILLLEEVKQHIMTCQWRALICKIVGSYLLVVQWALGQ